MLHQCHSIKRQGCFADIFQSRILFVYYARMRQDALSNKESSLYSCIKFKFMAILQKPDYIVFTLFNYVKSVKARKLELTGLTLHVIALRLVLLHL